MTTSTNKINSTNYAFKCEYCDNTLFTASPSGAVHCNSIDCLAVYAYGNKDNVIDWYCINKDEMMDFIQHQMEFSMHENM